MWQMEILRYAKNERHWFKTFDAIAHQWVAKYPGCTIEGIPLIVLRKFDLTV